MWKRVIRDYFAAFRWGKLKAGTEAGNWWMSIQFLFVLPVIWKMYEREGAWLQYYLVVVPLLFISFVLSLYPAVLPKIMYLCPVSPKERREYMNKSRIVRIVIPMCLSLIGVVIMGSLGNCHWILMLAVYTNHLFFAIFAASVTQYGTLDANGKRVIDMDTKVGILQGCMLVIAIITAFIQAGFAWDGNTGWVAWVLLCGIPTAIELPIVIWFCRHWPEAAEKAMLYETAVKIVAKKE